MAFSMNRSDDAVFVEREVAEASQFAGKRRSLIKTTLALSRRVKRNRNDQVGAIYRLAL